MSNEDYKIQFAKTNTSMFIIPENLSWSVQQVEQFP